MSEEQLSSSWWESPESNPDTFAAILGLLPDPVLVLDGQGQVLWGNDAAGTLFDLSLEEARGRSALEFIHVDDIELVLRSLESVQAKDVGTLIELRVKAGESWKLVEVIGRPAPELGPESIIFCIRDVTERRRFEIARDDVAKFRTIVQRSEFVTMLISSRGAIDSVSSALTRAFGHDPESVEGLGLVELFDLADRARITEALDRATRLTPVTVEGGCLHFGGHVIPVELTIASLLDDPILDGFVVSMRDVSDRVLAEREGHETLAMLSATLESTADGILVVNGTGHVMRYNRRFTELWGIPEELMTASNNEEALEFAAAQLVDPQDFISKVNELAASPTTRTFDTLFFRDGRVFERYSLPQQVGNETVGRVLSFRDVTDRKRIEESLAHRAFHDSLTGLANQSLFLERLHQAVKDRNEDSVVAVLFVDVDGLKAVNDSQGHIIGDQMLVQVADILRSSDESRHTLARLGGDEFGVLVELEGDPGEAVVLAEQILSSIRDRASVAPTDISLSIGVAYHQAGESGLEVLHHADVAMYSAKRHGRGRYEVYRPAEHAQQETARPIELKVLGAPDTSGLGQANSADGQ